MQTIKESTTPSQVNKHITPKQLTKVLTCTYIILCIYSLVSNMRLGVVKPCNLSTPKLVITHYNTKFSVRFNVHSIKIKCSWKPSGSGECTLSTRDAKLSNKWMEYQGIKNWDGLLDPLDDDLRGEILRYGGFVEAAYRCFEFDTSSPDYATCRYGRNSVLNQCGLREIGYKLTRNLRATSGVQLPGWIDRAPSWMKKRSSWIGYVAVCNDKEEIARLGRRDVVIALRGTCTCLEWIENFRATLAGLPGDDVDGGPMVESGFLSLYTSSTATCPSLRDMIREEIKRIMKSYGDEPLSVTITGHSLGAALATLTAYDITSTFEQPPLVTVISFGGPRVGNKNFSRKLEKNGTRILRIVNSNDVITKVPGFLIDECRDNRENRTVHLAGVPRWLKKHVEQTKWLSYADVGKELRLRCNNSDIATCHDLKTYLDLVNGFVSSTCPLRATAKKVLRRTQGEKQLLFR